MARRKKELLDLLKRKKQVARTPRPPAVKPVSTPPRGSQKKPESSPFAFIIDHPVWHWVSAAAALIFSVLLLDWLFSDCQGVVQQKEVPSVITTPDGQAPGSSFSITAGTYSSSDPERATTVALAARATLDPDGDGFPSVRLLQPLEYPDILEIHVGSASSEEELEGLLNQVKQITMPGQTEPEFRHSAYIGRGYQVQ